MPGANSIAAKSERSSLRATKFILSVRGSMQHFPYRSRVGKEGRLAAMFRKWPLALEAAPILLGDKIGLRISTLDQTKDHVRHQGR